MGSHADDRWTSTTSRKLEAGMEIASRSLTATIKCRGTRIRQTVDCWGSMATRTSFRDSGLKKSVPSSGHGQSDILGGLRGHREQFYTDVSEVGMFGNVASRGRRFATCWNSISNGVLMLTAVAREHEKILKYIAPKSFNDGLPVNAWAEVDGRLRYPAHALCWICGGALTVEFAGAARRGGVGGRVFDTVGEATEGHPLIIQM